MTDQELLAEQAWSSNYHNAIRANVRAFFGGIWDYNAFFSSMMETIERGLSRAFYAGAAECGIAEDELSPSELVELQTVIIGEVNQIDSLATFIETERAKPKATAAASLGRADLWILRAQDVNNRAKVMACKDKKLEWVLGATKEHCTTCAKLEGKVKRASQWLAKGISPQNPPNEKLECGGWKCLCDLVLSDKPMSRGPLPNVP